MTNDALATYLHQMVGIEFPPDQVERLRPLVELQAERLRQLESLDLGADDPRTMSYILDLRLSR